MVFEKYFMYLHISNRIINVIFGHDLDLGIAVTENYPVPQTFPLSMVNIFFGLNPTDSCLSPSAANSTSSIYMKCLTHCSRIFFPTDPPGSCDTPRPGDILGWWGGVSDGVTETRDCRSLDWPAGLVVMEHADPPDYENPDSVSLKHDVLCLSRRMHLVIRL